MDIEVLRCFAILFVLVGHLTALLVWPGNWQKIYDGFTYWGGVDLFFCVSGFVIASSLLREEEKQGRHVSFFAFSVPFWIKRVFRLWPAAFLWLVITIFLTKWFNRSNAFGELGLVIADAIAAVMQVANLHFLQCYIYKVAKCSTNGVYWSLSLEEQFYMIFPILFFFVPRKAFVLVAGAALLTQLFLTRSVWSDLWAVRTDAILFGVLIALLRASQYHSLLAPTFLKKWRYRWPLVILLLFLLASVAATPRSIVTFDTGLVAIISAILVFIASYGHGYVMAPGILRKIALYIGSRSYSIYLAHMPAYYATREILWRLYDGNAIAGNFLLRSLIIGLSLSFLFAELSYRFVEDPIRRIGHHKARTIRERANELQVRLAA